MFSDNGVGYRCEAISVLKWKINNGVLHQSVINFGRFCSRVEKINHQKKNPNFNPHFDNWVNIWAIFISKWVKILVIVMGFRNAFDPSPKNGIH